MYKTMKIYYDNVTGERIYYSSYGYEITPNLDRDYEVIRELSERVKETIGLLVLTDGQYAQDFETGRLIGVDIATMVPVFEYLNPVDPDEPIIPEKPLSAEITELKQENTLLKAQSQANADRADFQEDVITEIIMALYA